MVTSWTVLKKPDLSMALNGILAGLVGITAGADQMAAMSAVIIGLIAGALVVFSVLFFDKIKIDDPVGAISVHLVCGIWGTLKDAVIGVLNVYTAQPRDFDEDALRLLTLLASQSAIAIENATLHRDEMETREQLRQSEKLTVLGTLSAGLAHELRNPLNTVSMLMYAMGRDMSAEAEKPSSRFNRFSPDVEVIQGELQRMSLLIEQFLAFARPQPHTFSANASKRSWKKPCS